MGALDFCADFLMYTFMIYSENLVAFNCEMCRISAVILPYLLYSERLRRKFRAPAIILASPRNF